MSQCISVDTIPNNRDINIFRHPKYMKTRLHVHNDYEIVFVAKGHIKFSYDNRVVILNEGYTHIIFPSHSHYVLVEDESLAFSIFIKPSTFNTNYFHKLMLRNPSKSLLYFSMDTSIMKYYIRHMIIESNCNDIYANSRCISYFNLFFIVLLRSYGNNLFSDDFYTEYDITNVLQYIQNNYKTVTLSSLSKTFHYSEPHLSTMIKQNTGYTLSEIIKQLRMSNAVKYLENTSMTISDIALNVGYKSTDHFSRVFRLTYKTSPNEYRKKKKS